MLALKGSYTAPNFGKFIDNLIYIFFFAFKFKFEDKIFEEQGSSIASEGLENFQFLKLSL